MTKLEQRMEEFRDVLLSQSKAKVDFAQNKQMIAYWIMGWPVSVVESAIGDVIDSVEAAVRRIANSTYSRWSESAMAEMESKLATARKDETNERTR